MANLLHNLFTVSSRSISTDIDIRWSIKKRRETFVFQPISNEDTINLSYVSNTNITPENNIGIIDKSGTIIENRFIDSSYYTVIGSTFSSYTSKLYITDIFTSAINSQDSTPIFYKHKLSQINIEKINSTEFSYRTLIESSIVFLDKNFNPITNSEYDYDNSTGTLYHNLLNDDDNIYFIQYAIKRDDGSIITNTTYSEIINSEPIYREVTYTDYDSFGNIISGSKVYTLTETTSSYQFTMPTGGTYAWRETENSNIFIKGTNALDNSIPWYLRIVNGNFKRYFATTGLYYKYYLPEFTNQSFDPYYPYKKYSNLKCSYIDKNIIKFPTSIFTSNFMPFEVKITDENDNLLYLYTTDSTLINTAFNDSINYTNGILSIDTKNGYIHIKDSILDIYKISATYYSDNDFYEVMDIDFNPINNVEILNQRIVFYVVPEVISTRTNSLYYLIVDHIGRITYCSQMEDSTNIDIWSLSTYFNSDGTPVSTIYYDYGTTNFINIFTTETTNDPIGTYPSFFVIGEITVGNNIQVPTLYDSRVQGGGIKDRLKAEALAIEPEVSYFSNYRSKLPFPGMNTCYIELPTSLLDTYSGNFTETQVRDIIYKHLQFGNYPCIRYYNSNGGNFVISSCTLKYEDYEELGNQIVLTISWSSYGSNFTYAIYIGSSQNNLTLIDSNLVDNSSGNEYKEINTNINSLTGMNLTYEQNQSFYIKLVATDTLGYTYDSPIYRIDIDAFAEE